MISRRKEIYELLHPETKAGAAQAAGMNKAIGRGDVSDNLSFTTNTAAATGKDKRTVERAAARGEALGDDLKAVEGRCVPWITPARARKARPWLR